MPDETLLEIVRRGAASSRRFLEHLEAQSRRMGAIGNQNAADKLRGVIQSVKELLEFEERTVERLEAGLPSDD